MISHIMNNNQYKVLLSKTKENEIELLSLFKKLDQRFLLLVLESV